MTVGDWYSNGILRVLDPLRTTSYSTGKVLGIRVSSREIPIHYIKSASLQL